MRRHIISCTVASFIGALTLMIVPASGFAEAPSVCAVRCPDMNTPVVEVTVLGEPRTENEIVVPLLPRRASANTRLEHEYFERLYSITSGMCESVEELQSKGVRTYTGFIVQLAQFDTIRQLLNKLLRHYNLGYAPDIEDFSEAWGLEFPAPPSSHKNRPYGIEGSSAGNSSFCTFTRL